MRRRSHETDVRVELGAPGRPGRIRVDLPPGLVKHGIESFASWAGAGLLMEATGDDPHHRQEDAALALGRAVRQLVGGRPRRRIADTTVPMDDALVHVALDLADRPFLALTGEFPTDVRHFLRSWTDEARWTLHIRVLAGDDLHHRVEAAFKGIGIAWASAMAPRTRGASRKGAVVWEGA